MKRWNGWGDENVHYALPPSAQEYLLERLGPLNPGPDAPQSAMIAVLGASRLPPYPGLDASPLTRLLHARGQSLPDWIDLRYGRVTTFPDGVAFPTSIEEVAQALNYARRAGAAIIPYGGGTSVVGHINPLPSERSVLTLSMTHLTRLLDLDQDSRVATFEAGVTGPLLEQQLRSHGYTLGHFPQSFEYSTLGGWVATRSSGQQSLGYGRIEQLFVGGRVETPRGPLILPLAPASAAGPDLRQLVLGSEGRLGVITYARVRVKPLPEAEEFHGVFFPSFEQGMRAAREIVQGEHPVSMLRLSDALETEVTLRLVGASWATWVERGLRWIGYGPDRCLLVLALTGSRARVHRTRREVIALCRRYGGWFAGPAVGRQWQKNRFRAPYLRNTLWEIGVAVDTLETAVPWSRLPEAARVIPTAIEQAMQAQGERVLAFAHLSHVYRDGASVYVTFLFRLHPDPEVLQARWRAMKHAASLTIQQLGGTISHQHGVGLDHAPYLEAELSPLGLDALRSVFRVFDPEGCMNPGKLLSE